MPYHIEIDFAEYLKSDAGRGLSEHGANSASKLINYFFSYRPYDQKTQLDETNIRAYVDHLKEVFGDHNIGKSGMAYCRNWLFNRKHKQEH